MNEVAIVTGASRGIGAAIAERLAAKGFMVLVNHRASADEAARVVAAIRAAGGRAEAIAADVAGEPGVLHLFQSADCHGRLALLVNNAAYFGRVGRRVENVDAQTLERVFATNAVGVFLCCREAVRRMSTRSGGTGGRILNISSTAAGRGSANDWVDYAASKAAVDTLTRGLALEMAADGVRVNALAAGLTDTDSHARAGLPERVRLMSPKVPLGRAASVAEIADTALWLLTQAPDFMTGSVVPVSGGF
ncbi:MAG: SDR family oxidoreductase [Alphaproteobacteria bacterium]|nr:SDR family oxidoreductase [Alphaproteobacteria bacterium]